MKRTLVLSTLTVATLFAAVGQAQVVISQVYGGGGNAGSGGATYLNDFIELKNVGFAPVDITGWSVQYASNAGPVATNGAPNNAWQVTPLTSVVLQPGQHYLIQQFSGGTTGAALPAADVIDTVVRPGNTPVGPGINMNATGAKVALVNTTTPLPARATASESVPNWSSLPEVKDFVGYGTGADHWEGAGRATAPSNQNSITRNNNGCDDSGSNDADFTAGPASPHNTASPVLICGTQTADLTVALTNNGCNPAVNAAGAYQVTATVTNEGGAAAPGAVLNVILPTNLTYASSSSPAGTPVYTPATRTVSVTLGNLNPTNGQGTLTVNGTVTAAGGVLVRANASTTGTEPNTGNNGATNTNVAVSPASPVSVIAVGADEAAHGTGIQTVIDVEGFPLNLRTVGRPYRSPDGSKFIMRADMNLSAEQNTCLIVGQIGAGGAVTYTVVARETSTAPAASLPTHKIATGSFNNLLSINNAGQFVYTCRLTDGVAANDKQALVKGAVGNPAATVMLSGDAVPAALGLTGATWTNFHSASLQLDGTVAFMGTVTGGGTTGSNNQLLVKNNGATLLARKGMFVPTGQAGGATDAMDVLDDDAGTIEGQGFRLSEDGTTWITTGELNTGNTTADDVVIVNGGVAAQEGTVLFGSGFTSPAAVTSAGVQIPWVHMEADGAFFIHGVNADGDDWIVRNGLVIAKTGAPLTPGNTEVWSDDGAIARGFNVAVGNGGDYVVGGLTSIVTSIPDPLTDGVLVLNGATVVLRENQAVDLGGGNIRYINFIADHRAFIGAGRKLYVNAILRDADDICDGTTANPVAAMLVIDLPQTQPACPADVGIQGGTPGQDGLLNNNDFIVFIAYFFTQNPLADVGVQGGFPGSDGLWNNNDFVIYINSFFAGCPN